MVIKELTGGKFSMGTFLSGGRRNPEWGSRMHIITHLTSYPANKQHILPDTDYIRNKDRLFLMRTGL